MATISDAEKDFLTKGIEEGLRADGRGLQDMREFVVQTGVIAQASGSCRIVISGATDVLVGVKLSVGDVEGNEEDDGDGTLEMDEDEGKNGSKKEDVGRIVCSVDWYRNLI
jgi:exosome complex component RRP42